MRLKFDKDHKEKGEIFNATIRHVASNITKTCSCNIQRFFTAVKMKNFRIKNDKFFTSTHNLCFRAKIRNFCYYIKEGCKGCEGHQLIPETRRKFETIFKPAIKS